MGDFMQRLFKIDERVRLIDSDGVVNGRFGKVAGYSSNFPVFYIVILDEPLTHAEHKGWTAVNLPGSMLELA